MQLAAFDRLNPTAIDDVTDCTGELVWPVELDFVADVDDAGLAVAVEACIKATPHYFRIQGVGYVEAIVSALSREAGGYGNRKVRVRMTLVKPLYPERKKA